uniref:Replication-associated protein n=1 Tax=Nandayus nenday Genomoviridae sp. TaxID=2814968 RepID=A0A8E7G1Z2_9VIRU
MTFRFAAKHGLLTYSALGSDMDAVEGLAHRIVEHLGVLGAECIIGRENHLDGGLHLHAFFMFERKFESRNVRIFDVDGKHPNIVRGYSNADAGCAYACKEGDIVGGGLDPGSLRAPVDRHGGVWNEIILSETREEFFDACRRLAPRALLCSFTSLKCYADWKYRDIPEPYRSPVDLEFQPEVVGGLREWVESTLDGNRGEPPL